MGSLLKIKSYMAEKFRHSSSILDVLFSSILEVVQAFRGLLRAFPVILVLSIVAAFFFAPEQLRTLIASIVNIEPEKTLSVLGELSLLFTGWLNLYLVLAGVTIYAFLREVFLRNRRSIDNSRMRKMGIPSQGRSESIGKASLRP